MWPRDPLAQEGRLYLNICVGALEEHTTADGDGLHTYPGPV